MAHRRVGRVPRRRRGITILSLPRYYIIINRRAAAQAVHRRVRRDPRSHRQRRKDAPFLISVSPLSRRAHTRSEPPLSAPRGNRSPRRAPGADTRTVRPASMPSPPARPGSARRPGNRAGEVRTMLGLWVRARAGSVIRARAADPGPVTRRARPREFDVASLAGVPVPQGRECDPCRARRARSGAGRGREAGEKTAWLCSPSSWGCSQAHLRARHWQGGWNGA